MRTMERMLAAAEIIRAREDFDGYIHLKLLPGASDAAVEAAARLASRVSINVEAPNGAYLAQLGHRQGYAARHPAPDAPAASHGAGGHLPSGHLHAVRRRRGGRERSRDRLQRALAQRRVGPAPRLFRPLPARAGYAAGGRWRRRTTTASAALPGRLADARLRPELTTTWPTPSTQRGNLPLGVDPKVAVALARPEASRST